MLIFNTLRSARLTGKFLTVNNGKPNIYTIFANFLNLGKSLSNLYLNKYSWLSKNV